MRLIFIVGKVFSVQNIEIDKHGRINFSIEWLNTFNDFILY